MPQSQDVTLTAVLNDRLLLIPDYQRPYAWQLKQLTDLWEDIDLVGPRGTHYAGTLVLRDVLADGSAVTSMDQDGTTLRHTEVVDGQQRLTTCLILLDRLRRRFATLDGSVDGAAPTAARLRRVFGIITVDKAERPKLELGADLNTFWVDSVLGDHPHSERELLSGQSRLRQAATFFDRQLDQMLDGDEPEDKYDRLRDLQKRVTDGLRFLVYEVSSAAEVGTIFETLNERGKGLSDLEKTKNYLLYLARHIDDARSEQLADFINEKWSGIFRNLADLDDSADDQLMRAHWLATQNPTTESWRKTASVKQTFLRTRFVSGASRLVPESDTADGGAWTALDSEVRDYVRTLHECSFFLVESLYPAHAFQAFGKDRVRAQQASQALLNTGAFANYQPLLFACRLRFPEDGRLYINLVELLEKYSARVFVIAQRRADAGRSRLYRLAHDLFTGSDPQVVLDKIRTTLLQYAPDDRVKAALTDTSEDWYSRRGHKYFLYEYEMSRLAQGEELREFDFFATGARSQRTTEHILPQNPSYGEKGACWRDAFTDEQRQWLTHSLGNLVLTLDNSAYSNHCFDKKRGVALAPGVDEATCFAQGKLHQERDLAQYESWTPETIAARQSVLVDWAMARWHVDPPHLRPTETDEYEDDDQDEDLDLVPALTSDEK